MDYAAARRNMVESQLRPNRVTDPGVLDALASTPRELFVPAAVRDMAYTDDDIPLGSARFMMEPMFLGRLLQLASIGPTDVALVVGAGSGFAAAIVARLASRVVAIESDPTLAAGAKQTLAALGTSNAAIVEGRMSDGAPHLAPFDVIFFDGSVAEIPAGIIDQLGEGGRLVAVENQDRVGHAVLLTRDRGVVARLTAFDASVPPLPGFERAPVFSF